MLKLRKCCTKLDEQQQKNRLDHAKISGGDDVQIQYYTTTISKEVSKG